VVWCGESERRTCASCNADRRRTPLVQNTTLQYCIYLFKYVSTL